MDNALVFCKLEGEAVSEAWDSFVSEASSTTLAHLYGWRRVIAESYGHNAFYLAAKREGKITGILPLVQVKSRLWGNTLTSMPFQDYGGIVAQDEEVFQFLMERALQLKKEYGARIMDLRYRNEPFSSAGQAHGNKVTLALDIAAGAEALWKSFPPKVRNQVRKAEKSGLSVKSGGTELLEEFFRPFAVNMRDLGSPVHHPRFFEKIFSVFGDNTRIMLVQEGRQTIGGLIAFFWKNTVTVPWASCYRRHFAKCPNNLLYWETIKYACERGCVFFDFGRSSPDSGTYHFKLQWGAKPIPLHWEIFTDNDAGISSESALLRSASRLWRHIPVKLANFLGPSLRKFITN